MSDVLVIIPTYNEAESLPLALEGILQSEPRADVLVVDDGSPDGTGAIADGWAQRTGRVQVMHRARKAGLGKAYLAGFAWALERPYPYVCEMDADLSHDPTTLPRLVDQAVQGCDLVLGSRWVKGGSTENWEAWRILLSKSGSLYARTVLGLSIRDLTTGFRCYRRETLLGLDLATVGSEGYAFQIELAFRAVLKGFRVCEVPIRFANRRAGVSKLSGGIVGEAVLLPWRLRLSGQPSRR